MYKLIILLVCVTYVCCDVQQQRRRIRQNTYLPPTNGYNYDKPNVPFPSDNNPQTIYPSQPPRTVRPPVVRPPVGPPTYVPPPQVRPIPTEHDHHEHHHEPGMPFDFNYSVNDAATNNDYSHQAVSDGDVTRGEYRIALPDGRTQIVRYTADWKNGYNAEVTYEGEAQYPEGPYGQPSNNINQGYKY